MFEGNNKRSSSSGRSGSARCAMRSVLTNKVRIYTSRPFLLARKCNVDNFCLFFLSSKPQIHKGACGQSPLDRDERESLRWRNNGTTGTSTVHVYRLELSSF